VTIQNVQFVQPPGVPTASWVNIAMDETRNSSTTSFYNTSSATVVYVYNYNDVTGDNFQTYYSYNKPSNATTRAQVQGWVGPIS
jgi:hypothetical protein